MKLYYEFREDDFLVVSLGIVDLQILGDFSIIEDGEILVEDGEMINGITRQIIILPIMDVLFAEIPITGLANALRGYWYKF